VNKDAPDSEASVKQLAALQQQVREKQGTLQKLRRTPQDRQTRDDILKLQSELNGLAGRANELEMQTRLLDHRDTGAALDNELMMLWVNDYPKESRLPNPLSINVYNPRASQPHVLIVTRLDGSTPQRVLDMINTTLKVEKTGLSGTAYFDARGNHGSNAYAAYDDRIRAAAAYLEKNTTLHVVLDDKAALLKAADCPDAALYCGWYSVRNYQDSCQWVPGAVGYHVASFEMVTLHTPGEKGWVVNLLDRGFCGTLGSVAEPYLDAFPLPDQFFPLLLSGIYTQGEVYALTTPQVSWQMSFVGDPLYNPYKAHPLITRAQLEENKVLARAFEIMPLEKAGAAAK